MREEITYAFGRDGIAAVRLGIVHDIFSPAGRELVEAVRGDRTFGLVVDLGCGPGHTTRMLGELLHPARLVGLDLGREFLDIARRDVAGAEFIEHDLTRIPFPEGPADLMYARYVLTHLQDVPGRLRDWGSQLVAGGLLLVEENEWVEASEPAFERYMALATEVLAHGGTDMYIGSRLEADLAGLPLRVVVSRVREVSPPSSAVARMFGLNLRSWGEHPGAQAHAEEVAWLRGELERLSESSETGRITWGLRQLAVERTA